MNILDLFTYFKFNYVRLISLFEKRVTEYEFPIIIIFKSSLIPNSHPV